MLPFRLSLLKMFVVAVGIYMLVATQALYGQLNESDTAKLQLRFGLSGAWQKGNINLSILRAQAEAVSNGKMKWVFKTQNNALLQKFAKKLADRDFTSRNFIYYNPKRRFYPFGMIQLQGNYRRGINFRQFSGAGLTWQILHKPLVNVKLSGSLVYETTQFVSDQFDDSNYDGNRLVKLGRMTVYASAFFRFPGNRTRLSLSAFYQPAMTDLKNLRSQFDASLETPLLKNLLFSTTYLYTYEQLTLSNTKQSDQILTFGLVYRLTNN